MQSIPLHVGSLSRILKDAPYFQAVSQDAFLAAQGRAQWCELEPGEIIIDAGSSPPYAWFLAEGSVVIESDQTQPRKLRAGEAEAGYPLANLRPTQYTVRADLECKLVRLEQAFVRSLAQKPRPPRFLGGSEVGGGTWQNHAYALEVERVKLAGSFRIPAIPGISSKISATLQQDDFDLDQVALLISADPSIAGGLVNIANSALFKGRGTRSARFKVQWCAADSHFGVDPGDERFVCSAKPLAEKALETNLAACG